MFCYILYFTENIIKNIILKLLLNFIEMYSNKKRD
jgi:hypothetical protein